MRTAKAIFISIGWILSGVAASGASPGGVLSGAVVDDKGTPMANALVVYRSVPTRVTAANGQRVPAVPVVGSGVKTAADGTFVVNGLPAAIYYLCAYGVKDTDLGSCEWGQGTTRVDLASGQTVQLQFQVAPGTMLTFQVQDPKDQIRDLEGLQTANAKLPLSGANFAIGVWAGSRYVRAALVSTSGATRRYQLAIPKTAAVRLFLDTSLNVVDASNMAIAAGRPGATLAAAGQAEVITNLTIP
jgi:hypothetical protein